MISVLLTKKAGFRFSYELIDGDKKFYGGLTEEGFLVFQEGLTQKELMFRTLVFKCMNDFVSEIKTRDEWEQDLTRYGFVKEQGLYRASWDMLKFPHDCGD